MTLCQRADAPKNSRGCRPSVSNASPPHPVRCVPASSKVRARTVVSAKNRRTQNARAQLTTIPLSKPGSHSPYQPDGGNSSSFSRSRMSDGINVFSEKNGTKLHCRGEPTLRSSHSNERSHAQTTEINRHASNSLKLKQQRAAVWRPLFETSEAVRAGKFTVSKTCQSKYALQAAQDGGSAQEPPT